MALVKVTYNYRTKKGGHWRSTPETRIIPVQLGYMTKSGINRTSEEDVRQLWKISNRSPRAEFQEIVGYGAIQPRSKRKGRRVFSRKQSRKLGK